MTIGRPVSTELTHRISLRLTTAQLNTFNAAGGAPWGRALLQKRADGKPVATRAGSPAGGSMVSFRVTPEQHAAFETEWMRAAIHQRASRALKG